MEDREIRAALDRHWAASDANDLEGEHQIYREDAVLEYPQSGERIRGRRKIQPRSGSCSADFRGEIGDCATLACDQARWRRRGGSSWRPLRYLTKA
jgi:ketosteroid isomerase-like protein